MSVLVARSLAGAAELRQAASERLGVGLDHVPAAYLARLATVVADLNHRESVTVGLLDQVINLAAGLVDGQHLRYLVGTARLVSLLPGPPRLAEWADLAPALRQLIQADLRVRGLFQPSHWRFLTGTLARFGRADFAELLAHLARDTAVVFGRDASVADLIGLGRLVDAMLGGKGWGVVGPTALMRAIDQLAPGQEPLKLGYGDLRRLVRVVGDADRSAVQAQEVVRELVRMTRVVFPDQAADGDLAGLSSITALLAVSPSPVDRDEFVAVIRRQIFGDDPLWKGTSEEIRAVMKAAVEAHPAGMVPLQVQRQALGLDAPSLSTLGALAQRWRGSVQQWLAGLRPEGTEPGWLEQRIGLWHGTTFSQRLRRLSLDGVPAAGGDLQVLLDIGVLARAVFGAGTGLSELASMRRLVFALRAEPGFPARVLGTHLENAVRILRSNGDTALVIRQDLQTLLAVVDKAKAARGDQPVRLADLRPFWAEVTGGAAPEPGGAAHRTPGEAYQTEEDPRARADLLIKSIGTGDTALMRRYAQLARIATTEAERSIGAVLEQVLAILENQPGPHVLASARNVGLNAHRADLARQLVHLSNARPEHAGQLTELAVSVATCP